MVKTIYSLLVILCFATCKSEIKSQLTSKDTSEIAKTILADKRLYNDYIDKYDTIYIIKSKIVNKNWPSETTKSKLIYIEPTKKNEDLIDLSPASFYNKKARIDFGSFFLNKDTVNVSLGLYQYQKISIYNYKLKYENTQWTIVKLNKRGD